MLSFSREWCLSIYGLAAVENAARHHISTLLFLRRSSRQVSNEPWQALYLAHVERYARHKNAYLPFS